ncbi:MAG TPA: thioredoxin family protein [Clostridiaceae bacterium]|nr:thioredoxin family protein [Clostridiaceae bacterium]
MEENIMTKKSQGIVAKIVVPILIILAIGVIWHVKNLGKSPAATSDNPDFSLHVTEKIDLEKLKSYGLPIILDFGADYCLPCLEMAPVIEKLNKDLQGKAIIKYIDVEKYPEFTVDYPVMVIPTQIFFDKEGKPYTPSDSMALQMNMYSLKSTNEHVFTTHEGIMTEEQLLAILKEMGMKE